MDLDVLGQDVPVEVLGLCFNALQHLLGLLARAHQDDTFHGVILVLVTKLAQARRVADHHAAKVLCQNGNAIAHRQHDVADVLRRLQPAQAADVIKLSAF